MEAKDVSSEWNDPESDAESLDSLGDVLLARTSSYWG